MLSFCEVSGVVCRLDGRGNPRACMLLVVEVLSRCSRHLILHAVHPGAHAYGSHLHLVLQVRHFPVPIYRVHLAYPICPSAIVGLTAPMMLFVAATYLRVAGGSRSSSRGRPYQSHV